MELWRYFHVCLQRRFHSKAWTHQDEGETEEEEGDRILKEVFDEIGVSVTQQVSLLS